MDKTPTSRTDAITHLTATRDAILPYFAVSAEVQARTYAPGKWTVRQLLIHIADAETVNLDRVRRLAAEQEPVIMGFDPDRWTALLGTDRRDLAITGVLFNAARAAIIDLVRILPADLDARSGVHTEYGPRTLGEQIAIGWRHAAHHLEQVQAAANGRTWTPAG
jgi:hypothetical protein